jgi:molecular chaperone GrpE
MPDEPQFTRQEPYFSDAAPESEGPQQVGSGDTPAIDSEPLAPELGTSGMSEVARRIEEAERRAAEHQRAAAEHHEAWLRAKAEMENVRKRAQIEVANAHKYALEGFASDLLPVKDSLEATLAAENAALDALRSGVELTLKQLTAVFDKASLKEINPVGERFDPHRHQAISLLPSDKEPNTVINVLQKGYLLNDRVIRPALVTVAKGRDA